MLSPWLMCDAASSADMILYDIIQLMFKFLFMCDYILVCLVHYMQRYVFFLKEISLFLAFLYPISILFITIPHSDFYMKIKSVIML